MKKILVLLVFMFFMAIFDGWIFGVLWNWFVVPMYNYPITLFHGVGLSLFVALMTTHEYKKKSDAEFVEEALTGFFVALMMLALGWLAHTLM